MKKLFIILILSGTWFVTYSQQESLSGILLSTDSENTIVEQIVMINRTGSTQENLGVGELLIYPLKASQVLNVIKTSENKKIYICRFIDANGRVVKTAELDALHNEISLKNLDFGNYRLRITSGDKPVTEITISKEPGLE